MGYATEALARHTHELEPVILYNFRRTLVILDSIAFREVLVEVVVAVDKVDCSTVNTADSLKQMAVVVVVVVETGSDSKVVDSKLVQTR